MGNENEIEVPEPLCFIHDIIPLYFVTKDFDIDHIKYNYAYIMDAKGIKILKRSAIGTFLVDANKLEELPTIDEKIAISTEKIPSSIIQKTLAWFKRVYQDQTSEAIVFLFYHHTHGWEVKPPKQTAIGMSVDYEERPEMDGDGWTIAGTIHSHCNSSAFHSGTDESDEKEFDGIHLTIGKVMSEVPDIAYSIMIQGKRFKLTKDDLIESNPESTFPEEWMELIEKTSYTPVVVSGFGAYGNYWQEKNKKSEEDKKKENERWSHLGRPINGPGSTGDVGNKVTSINVTAENQNVSMHQILGLEGYDDTEFDEIKGDEEEEDKEAAELALELQELADDFEANKTEENRKEIVIETDNFIVTCENGMPVFKSKEKKEDDPTKTTVVQ